MVLVIPGAAGCCLCVSVCARDVDVSSAAVGRAVWPSPGAAQYVDESVVTDSLTWNMYPLTADGLW